MPLIFVRTLLVTVLLLVAGAHWTLLQSVAWVNMTVRFAREASLTEAISKTFSGKNPCRLCNFVSSGREAERQSKSEEISQRLEMILPEPGNLVTPLQLEPEPRTPYLVVAVQWPISPPTPPPRRA